MSKWKDVGEELPREGETIILATWDGRVTTGRYVIGEEFDFFYDDAYKNANPIFPHMLLGSEEPTHWQGLPKHQERN